MSERRYGEAEVRRIFELATRPGALQRRPHAAEGMTLAELQSIGAEAGVEADAIARAAAFLDTRPPRPARRSWGMPIEVGRLVPLRRGLTDHEWDQLVGELRSTFGARGRSAVQGSLREWSNGNLHVCVEPSGEGYRLRMGTVKGDAAGVNAFGAILLATGATALASLGISGELQGGLLVPALLGSAGSGAFLANLLRLPRWARQRERQMDHVAARVRAITSNDPA